MMWVVAISHHLVLMKSVGTSVLSVCPSVAFPLTLSLSVSFLLTLSHSLPHTHLVPLPPRVR